MGYPESSKLWMTPVGIPHSAKFAPTQPSTDRAPLRLLACRDCKRTVDLEKVSDKSKGLG